MFGENTTTGHKTRTVNRFQNLTHEDRLKRLGLTTPERRRKRGDLIEAFTM